MQKMYEQGCEGCSVELVDQQISLRGFLDQCPLDATEFKKRRKWERAIVRGGNCALNQTVKTSSQETPTSKPNTDDHDTSND